MVASGSGLTYQWRKNGSDIADGPTGNGSTYSGTATATLTITGAVSADAGDFDVVVSGSCPPAATSDSASATWIDICVIRWTGNAGTNDWHTAGNWDLGRTPIDNDDVVIPAVGASANVQYSTGTTNINALSSAKPFVLTNGTLGIAAVSVIDATYAQSGGTLQGNGAVTVSGLLTWSGGAMRGSGTTTANGGMALSNSGGELFMGDSRTLVNPTGQTATLSGSGSSSLAMHNSSTFTNNGTLDINAASGASFRHGNDTPL